MSAKDETETDEIFELERRQTNDRALDALNDSMRYGVPVPMTEEEAEEIGFEEDALDTEEALESRYAGLIHP